jgi:retron-type reverse transcriptase
MKFVEHRVADPRVLRLIRKFLRAGVSEDGQWSKTEVGTPQGAVISPFLANIYSDNHIKGTSSTAANSIVAMLRRSEQLQ